MRIFHLLTRGTSHVKARVLKFTLLTVLCTTSVASLAQSSACSLEISDRIVDYGSIARVELLSREHQGKAALGERVVTLWARCESPQRIGLSYNSASAAPTDSKVNVSLRILNAQLDGKSISLVSNKDPDKILTTLTAGDRVQPQYLEPGKTLSIQLELNTEVSTAPAPGNRSNKWEDTSVFQLFTP
ncbi:DUF1120 domain-containing protein [Bordetella sp. 15P40C-2]|uniref:DUF1120 domain-containing protein n=1 Tax=Bordetella sp. 15P40C-2 TaxID=2572246 RepID=UPI0013256E19|nr:DUF1120 domain-containing protein [Bordetella sp. 15P40C-2]MVW72520.1 hypothetical protein [Bordetella sp. 15P40C-2]